MVWVLASGYRLGKEAVLRALKHLEINHALVLEDAAVCRRALELFRSSHADYSGCVILAGCQARDARLHTFDKRLSSSLA